MKEAKDTFVMFLNDNLSTLSPPITVHVIRKDPNSPSNSSLQINSLNVGFGDIRFGVSTSLLTAKMDIVCDSELTAGRIAQKTWLVLSSAFFTPVYDYTVPSNPVATGTMLMWKPDRVRFIPVLDEKDDRYFRYSCTLALEFHNATT